MKNDYLIYRGISFARDEISYKKHGKVLGSGGTARELTWSWKNLAMIQ